MRHALHLHEEACITMLVAALARLSHPLSSFARETADEPSLQLSVDCYEDSVSDSLAVITHVSISLLPYCAHIRHLNSKDPVPVMFERSRLRASALSRGSHDSGNEVRGKDGHTAAAGADHKKTTSRARSRSLWHRCVYLVLYSRRIQTSSMHQAAQSSLTSAKPAE